jgi:hypothetical protein
MEFDWDFQEWVKFEQGAPVYNWVIDQLMKRNLDFKFVSFPDLLP